jgi:NitT/TauT family transport system permease protein
MSTMLGNRRFWMPVVSVVTLVVIWGLASRAADTILFPSPLTTAKQAVMLIASQELQRNLVASLQRIAIGFAAGSILGAALGLGIGWFETVHALLQLPVQFFRFVPAIAWLSPMIVWFGIGETSKVLLIVYTTTFMVAVNTIAGCERLTRNKIRAAQCLGASPAQVFLSVAVPGTMADILIGMRVAMGNSFMTIIAAEMLAAQRGLGFMIIAARTFLDVSTIFVGIVVLGVLGFLADRAVAAAMYSLGGKYFPERVLVK